MAASHSRIIVIGAGHNGLTAAAYLARSGHEVLVLEAADHIGGAALTREFAPGFSVSACAHLLYLLDAGISAELGLAEQGLEMAAAELETIVLDPEGRHLKISASTLSGGDAADEDRAALLDFRGRMNRLAALLRKYFGRRPPRLAGGGLGDYLTLAQLGIDMRRLGREHMRELMRVIGMNVYDVLEENFQSRLLKGGLGLDAVLGTHLGPRSPNSMMTYLYRLTGGPPALPRGGMGAVSEALASAARASGAEIRTGAPVARILLDHDRVDGVELADGERIEARIVVSSADPRTTFLGLLGAGNLEAGFARAVDNIRMRGNAAKLHLALDGLPSFTGLQESSLRARLLIAPSLEYVERAFDHAKYAEYSAAPVMEITLPSLHDPGLAPDGKQVLSAIVQYAPYALKQGWETGRDAFLDKTLDTLAAYAPAIREHVVAAELVSPADIERDVRISGGHWHHGELALDQFMMLRPVPGAAQYASPIEGLYLCGAGSHPGGGVSGRPGRNAAREIAAREKSK